MKARDLFTCAWRELRRRRWRTGVTVLGYALSVTVLVVLASALRTARNEAGIVLGGTGTHFVAYSPVGGPECKVCRVAPSSPDAEGLLVYGQPTRLIPLEVVERARAIPTVRDASPYLLYRFRGPSAGAFVSVGGFDPKYTAAVGTTCCAPSDIVAGRFLEPDDSGKVLVEEAYALATGVTTGTRINLGGQAFEIVGVVNPGIRPGKADVYMHFPDVERLINAHGGSGTVKEEANVILVEARSSTVQEDAMRSVRSLLPGLVLSTYACYRPAAKVIGMNESAVWALSALLVVFAVLLASKSQLGSVLERRRDLAILRTVGWTRRAIVEQILSESVLQSVAGVAVGLLTALAVLAVVPSSTLAGAEGAPETALAGELALLSLPLGLLGGAIAGALPAAIAARARPAEALRRI